MFLLGKIIILLLKPLYWVMALLLAGYFSRKPARRKRLLISALLVFLIFSNPWIIKTLINAHQPPPVKLTPGRNFGYGILLGGMSGWDFGYQQGVFGEPSDRYIQTFRLYKLGFIKKILITGGNATLLYKNPFRESLYLKQTMIEMGIPEQDILTDPDSRNTYENAVNCKRILDSLGVKDSCLLITSAFHMPRAEGLYKKQGIKVLSYPCAYIERPGPGFDFESTFMPTTSAMDRWTLYLKEWLGIFSYKITGKI
jgi:uncharacterized SAM-binding protein YcdF (DUF218 family)